MPITHTEFEATCPEDVRAYLDDLVTRLPHVFERMALSEIRRLRPRLSEDEALSVAYDAAQAVVRLSEHVPVRLDTVLGLVRRYVRWAALDRLRQAASAHEVPAGIGADLPLPGTIDEEGSSTDAVRAAAGLLTLERMGARLRASLPDALHDGRLRLSADQLRALREADAVGSPCPDATARKRLERARAAIVRWVRAEARDEHERRLLALLLGDHLPAGDRRGREPELLRVLGLHRIALSSPGRTAAGRPTAVGTAFARPRSA